MVFLDEYSKNTYRTWNFNPKKNSFDFSIDSYGRITTVKKEDELMRQKTIDECSKTNDNADACRYMYEALFETNEDRLARHNRQLLDDNNRLRKENRRLVLTSNTVHSPKKVIYNNATTIVYWDDDTKTIVTCQEGDTFSYEAGYAMAFLKKHMGNKGHFNTDLAKIMDKAIDQDLRKEK